MHRVSAVRTGDEHGRLNRRRVEGLAGCCAFTPLDQIALTDSVRCLVAGSVAEDSD